MARACFELEEDSIKHPDNWKLCLNNHEVSNSAVGSSVELLIRNGGDKIVNFPDDAKYWGIQICGFETQQPHVIRLSESQELLTLKHQQGPVEWYHKVAKKINHHLLVPLLIKSVLQMETLDFDSRWMRYNKTSSITLACSEL